MKRAKDQRRIQFFYHNRFKNFFGYCAENNIALPTRETVLLYRQLLAAKFAPTTYNCYFSAVKAFIDFLKSKNYLEIDTDRIKVIKLQSVIQKSTARR